MVTKSAQQKPEINAGRDKRGWSQRTAKGTVKGSKITQRKYNNFLSKGGKEKYHVYVMSQPRIGANIYRGNNWLSVVICGSFKWNMWLLK